MERPMYGRETHIGATSCSLEAIVLFISRGMTIVAVSCHLGEVNEERQTKEKKRVGKRTDCLRARRRRCRHKSRLERILNKHAWTIEKGPGLQGNKEPIKTVEELLSPKEVKETNCHRFAPFGLRTEADGRKGPPPDQKQVRTTFNRRLLITKARGEEIEKELGPEGQRKR
jgi:hypothetical protein